MIRDWWTPSLDASPYPSPEAAEREMDELAQTHPGVAERLDYGRSREGRPLRALRIGVGGAAGAGRRPALLVTAQIHAVEYVGSFVARDVARRLVRGCGRDAAITALLERADVWVAPLLNPDGAARVWRRRGRSGLGSARFTAGGVDPNRNFPFDPVPGRGGWNTGRNRPGSAWYRGPQPLSEPECLALARLARGERFCAAVNFHSFGGVVYMPVPQGPDTERAARAFGVFDGPFQDHQAFLRYRAVPERPAQIVGQLDAFLFGAFGTPSVTVEVSRPGLHLLDPRRATSVFWWANPPDPERWARNDAPATVAALVELLARTGGEPCAPPEPALAERVPA